MKNGFTTAETTETTLITDFVTANVNEITAASAKYLNRTTVGITAFDFIAITTNKVVDSNLSDYIKVSDNVTTLGIGAEVVLKQATTNSVSTGVETTFAGFDVSSQRHTLNFGTTEAETTKAKRIQMTTVQTSVENITQQLTTTSPRGTTHSSGGALTNGKITNYYCSF